ncbi:hypothetical protein [Frankia nepalensis]|uniref:hypothetical protein n=1 Tax=Frankia nepalensis TaxID=1836974 RepID=UPI001EE4B2D0|nr:hypothetical protein [Frankia nepalensis]
MTMNEPSALISRRGILAAGLGLTTLTAAAMLATPAAASGLWHTDWRFCNRCHGLVRYPSPVQNRCPAGFSHAVQGWTFGVPFTNSTDHHAGETAYQQSDWQICRYCSVLYYHDFPGVCAGRGGSTHLATGPQYLLLHDRNPVPSGFQTDWRFCYKCSSLYFDGYDPNGVCPGNPGWGHAAAGYMFHLQVYAYTA